MSTKIPLLGMVLQKRRIRRKFEALPNITVTTEVEYSKHFTSPSPCLDASIYSVAGERVGTASFTVSPINDRAYIYEIKVSETQRRKGYATAFLQYLAQRYQLPITTIYEVHSAANFWGFSRLLMDVGILVTEPISISDTKSEANRWIHLQPEAERLEKLIADRMNIHREPWHIARSRGFED